MKLTQILPFSERKRARLIRGLTWQQKIPSGTQGARSRARRVRQLAAGRLSIAIDLRPSDCNPDDVGMLKNHHLGRQPMPPCSWCKAPGMVWDMGSAHCVRCAGLTITGRQQVLYAS